MVIVYVVTTLGDFSFSITKILSKVTFPFLLWEISSLVDLAIDESIRLLYTKCYYNILSVDIYLLYTIIMIYNNKIENITIFPNLNRVFSRNHGIYVGCIKKKTKYTRFKSGKKYFIPLCNNCENIKTKYMSLSNAGQPLLISRHKLGLLTYLWAAEFIPDHYQNTITGTNLKKNLIIKLILPGIGPETSSPSAHMPWDK